MHSSGRIQTRRGWIHFGVAVYLIVPGVFAVPGTCFVLLGINLAREAREERESNEAMALSDRERNND